MKNFILTVALAWAVLRASLGAAAPAEFRGLDDLPGGEDVSFNYAISANGRIVAGESFSALTSQHGEGVRWIRHAKRWTTNGIGLPTNPPTALNTPALGMSSDGQVLVGRVSFVQLPPHGFETVPYCWTAKDGFKFPLPPAGYVGAQGQSVTAGAGTVAGWGWGAEGRYTDHPRALVWRGSLSSGWQVERLAPALEGMALGVDNSGRLIIGWARSPASVAGSSNGIGHEAVIWAWKEKEGWTTRWLGALPGQELFSQANGLTRGSGKFVVGASGDALIKTLPVRWKLDKTKRPQIQSLGLPTGFTSGFATAVSANGRTVVGSCSYTLGEDFFPDTFVWEDGEGVSLLQPRLLALGETGAAGWNLISATGISDDGRTICGYGTNPQGDYRCWVAVLPKSHKGDHEDRED